VLWQLAWNGKAVRVEYRRRLPELTSRENWTRLFTLVNATPPQN
jgi:hypothetical protein